jgi:hypothetical protein
MLIDIEPLKSFSMALPVTGDKGYIHIHCTGIPFFRKKLGIAVLDHDPVGTDYCEVFLQERVTSRDFSTTEEKWVMIVNPNDRAVKVYIAWQMPVVYTSGLGV